MVKLDPHVYIRLPERDATEAEVIETVETGKRFRAKKGRTGFFKEFAYNADWNGNFYATKKIEAFAVRIGQDWLVVTIITKFY